MVHAVLAVGGKQLLTRKHSASTTIWVRKAQRNKEALCEHHNLGSLTQNDKEAHRSWWAAWTSNPVVWRWSRHG